MVDGGVDRETAIPFDRTEGEAVPVERTGRLVLDESAETLGVEIAVVDGHHLDVLGRHEMTKHRTVVLDREPRTEAVVTPDELVDRRGHRLHIQRGRDVECHEAQPGEPETGGFVAPRNFQVFLLLMRRGDGMGGRLSGGGDRGE